MTYSINIGSITEANKLVDLNSTLNELPDNTTKLIDPHDLRDAIFTTWENIVIKPTKNDANIEYIGIDRSDIYEKIFLGKKKISNSDVLSLDLLNSNVDLFIFNTKNDVDLFSQNTKIGFLAGSSQSIFTYGGVDPTIPYIETRLITNSYGNVLDFDIKNDSYVQSDLGTISGGNITIESKYANILINGLVFPTIDENLTITDDYVLKYKKIGGVPYMKWGSLNLDNFSNIISSSTISITGNPVLINGYDFMFSDENPVPVALGAIVAGSTFSNVAVTEMLRRILYPYIAPVITLSSSVSNIEISSISQVVIFNYSINKIVATSSILSITTNPFIIVDTTTPITYLNSTPTIDRHYSSTVSNSMAYSTYGTNEFIFSVNDNIGGTVSTSCVINSVYPIFYGVSTTASSTQSIVQGLLSSFTKIVNNNPNQTISVSGNSVCIYYCVPSIYNLTNIISTFYDSNSPSFDISSVFRGSGTPFTMSLHSPDIFSWGDIIYNCYIYSPSGDVSTTTIGTSPLYTANYQFNF